MEKRLKKKLSLRFKKLKEKSWGTIVVSNDEQLDHWLEPMPAGSEGCPSWYSVRLFKGTETSPGTNKQPEYWLGVCNVFLPIIPIPVIGAEIVIKLGDNLDYYYTLKNKFRTHLADELLRHTSKYFNKIINKATVKFTNCDVKYKNDEIYETPGEFR